MEPMALGSPSSPQSGSSSYLPAYLIGEPMTPPPRTTTVSPTKGGGARASLAFGQSPSSPKDHMNRSSAFHSRHPLSPTPGSLFLGHQPTPPGQSLNASISGPPTQGLFDTLSTERNFAPDVGTPRMNASIAAGGLGLQQQHFRPISSPFTPPPSQQQQQPNEMLYNVNTPRRQSIIPGPKHNFTSPPFPGVATGSANGINSTVQGSSECWVTVFGFPQSATSMILSHFSQCGTIVNRMHPQNTGNWMHLRFTSRLECDRALNYNEKVLNNFFMIGVTRCKDPAVLELESHEDVENSSFVGNSVVGAAARGPGLNSSVSGSSNSSIRPLAHVAYKTVQSPADVTSPLAPTKSSGILDRAMDFFLGW